MSGSGRDAEADAVVRLTVEGGVARLPGLAAPRTVDTASLPDDQRAELWDLLARAGLLPGTPERTPPEPPRRGADRQTYTVTVESGGERRAVRLVDPVQEEPYRSLVPRLRALARPGS